MDYGPAPGRQIRQIPGVESGVWAVLGYLQINKKIVSLHLGIEIWCNGSTTDFGSVCSGSNPDIPT